MTPAIAKATANPTISDVTDPGTAPELGDELSCSNATWTDTPTSFEYQWLREGVGDRGGDVEHLLGGRGR